MVWGSRMQILFVLMRYPFDSSCIIHLAKERTARFSIDTNLLNCSICYRRVDLRYFPSRCGCGEGCYSYEIGLKGLKEVDVLGLSSHEIDRRRCFTTSTGHVILRGAITSCPVLNVFDFDSVMIPVGLRACRSWSLIRGIQRPPVRIEPSRYKPNDDPLEIRDR